MMYGSCYGKGSCVCWLSARRMCPNLLLGVANMAARDTPLTGTCVCRAVQHATYSHYTCLCVLACNVPAPAT
jgi:hypothetical protein